MLEIALFTLSRGAIYALVAVGFVLVFSVGGVLNLAHGTLFMLGGYFTYLFYGPLFGGRWLLPAVALAVLSTCAVAALLHVVLLRRRLQSGSYVMVMTLAVALFVEQCLRAGFGTTSTGVPALLSGSQTLLGVRLLNVEMLLFPVALALLAALWAYLRHTSQGRSIIAVAQNRQGALLVGMDASRVVGGTVVIAAGLAALAGALVAPTITLVPTIWAYWLVKAFAIAILGGLGSLPGAVVAAFVLSFAEVLTTFVLSDQFADLVALLVIVLVLILRPSGFFATRSL
ncbi:branched-chain amino acid ABC transporter permease [Mitsuaria sp. WAJ17]|uniref:branched-chain amino acid ABC transporter permease n=1 Tax=Mitsuaria sp. WAJ17 TaxID=2761452 RepID=UPI0016025707|nr:branched-chain amino acid ABC transporter permease [Mitsuaria sp. WAJ17]MBB2485476.1 branched-chain amino acid ABC transporter permease [Mitsuaria sp. WAJ17]